MDRRGNLIIQMSVYPPNPVFFQSHWYEFINDFKMLLQPDPRSILRLSLSQEELDSFWQSLTLLEMEKIFILTSQTVINYLYNNLIPHYLANRRITQETFSVSGLDQKGQERCLMYVYDCRLFKVTSSFTKEENDLVSSFMMVYREGVDIKGRVYEMVSPNDLPRGQWMLKVKESGLFKVYTYLRENLKRVRHRSDKVVISQDFYDGFVQNWSHNFCTYNIENTVVSFFRAVVVLLQNQLMLAYLRRLSPQETITKMFLRPIRIIDKPKNVEQFTLTEGGVETETKWQSLKVTAFKLKYKIEEGSSKYECYMVEEPQKAEFQAEDYSEEDMAMVQAFAIQTRKHPQRYPSASSFYS